VLEALHSLRELVTKLHRTENVDMRGCNLDGERVAVESGQDAIDDCAFVLREHDRAPVHKETAGVLTGEGAKRKYDLRRDAQWLASGSEQQGRPLAAESAPQRRLDLQPIEVVEDDNGPGALLQVRGQVTSGCVQPLTGRFFDPECRSETIEELPR